MYDIPKIGEFFTLAQRIIRVIIPVLDASHVTIGTFGREIEHAHLWIVPQYRRERRVIEGEKWTEGSQEEVGKLLREALKPT